MRVAAQVVLTEDQALRLESYARGRRTAARLVLRANIVLLAAQGRQDLEIAAHLGVVPPTAARWRARFLKSGSAGLEKDAPRPGKATVLTQHTVRRIVAMTTQQKPVNATHWSTRSMAAHLEGAWTEAAPARQLQVEQRSPLRREAGRHRRPLSESTRTRAGALAGRKEPDPGAGPHPDHDPRLQEQRNHHVVRRAQHAGRHRDGHLHAAPPPSGVAEVLAPDRPPAVGSTWSSASSATSPKINFDAGSSACKTSKPPSTTTSACITNSQSRLSGQQKPPISSKK